MNEKKRRAAAWIITILIVAGCVWALYVTDFFEAVKTAADLKAYIERCAPWSHLVFFCIQLFSVILAPIPSNITAAAGAILFGLWGSFLLTWSAVVIGSVLVFGLARVLGQPFTEQFVSKKISDKYLDIIRRKRDTFLLMAFLFPFFPDDILCILAGVTDIPFKRFVWFVLLARPWGLLVSSVVGSSALNIPAGMMVIIGIIAVPIFVLAMLYGDKMEAKILEWQKK